VFVKHTGEGKIKENYFHCYGFLHDKMGLKVSSKVSVYRFGKKEKRNLKGENLLLKE
jgi:hypothetical protein